MASMKWAQVMMRWQGRTLLGDVRDEYVEPLSDGAIFLKVTHFNGQPWPFDPAPTDVTVLERDVPASAR